MKFPSGKDFIKMMPLIVVAVVLDNLKVATLILAVTVSLILF